MSVWVAPASSTERKPEPRMSAGLRNLISWLLPSLADHNCISRVREWPLAEVMVIVMVATLVLGAASASMASVTSWAVWYCWADAKPRSAASRTASSAVRRCGFGRVGAGWLRMRYLHLGCGVLGTGWVAQEYQAGCGQQRQRGCANGENREGHEGAEGADRHELADDHGGETGAERECGEEDGATGTEDGIGHGGLGQLAQSALLHVAHR